jgi:hypothetical protein
MNARRSVSLLSFGVTEPIRDYQLADINSSREGEISILFHFL